VGKDYDVELRMIIFPKITGLIGYLTEDMKRTRP
jgi:hypothetical protein